MIALLLAGADVVCADARGVYVAPDGDIGGKGTTDAPWDIASALDGRKYILPGTTIYLKGGLYRFPDRSRNTQGYQVRLKGTEQAPIHVRPVSGERVTIDGYMQILSPTEHLWMWDLEFITAETEGWNRTIQEKGSHPDSIGVPKGGLNIIGGKNCKYINLIVHGNASSGIGFWRGAIDSELHGCLIYDNGWIAPDRYHGPGIYTQNEDGQKWITDCMIFANYSTTIQAYGSKNAWVDHFRIVGNFAFDPIKAGGRQRILVGGGRPSVDILVAENVCFEVPIQIGYGAAGKDGRGIVARGNTVVRAGLKVAAEDGQVRLEDNFVWEMGAPLPRAPNVFLRPNKYDSDRAHLAVLNWTGVNQVAVSVAGFLRNGDAFRLMNPYDVYGEPVVEGVVRSGKIVAPLKGDFTAYVLLRLPTASAKPDSGATATGP
jgi:hypothetical protein